MAFRLIPRDVKFYDLFVADGDNLAKAAERLSELVDHYDRLEERIAEIQALEKRGDEIDHEINARLEDAFVTPFDREDIHDLTVRIDDVVDGIQAVAETFVIYDVKAPTQECRRMAAILRDQGTELAAALRKLDGMKGISPHLDRVTELEHEADGLSRAAVGQLFRDGQEPLEVIKWRDIYRELENAIDAAEDAAEAMERMLAKGA
jgi:predicted phosphate transport protein (TIGR00153 family)